MEPAPFSFPAMNTKVRIWFEPAQELSPTEFAGFQTDMQLLFQQIEDTCSRFKPDSELSRINADGADGKPLPISPLLYDLLQEAKRAYQDTNGLFHPGLLRPLQAAGYNASFENLQPQTDAEQELPLPTPELPFHLDSWNRTVTLRPDVQLDLGGIAKGWTVDRAVSYLERHGRGYVNAGGDLRVFGQVEEPWRIGVEDPFDPKQDLAILTLHHGALATSSTVKRRWQQNSTWMHHLIDPQTGRPSTSSIASATVTAPTAVQADVWAKTVLLLGPERGAEFLQQKKQQGVVLEHSRRLHVIQTP